MSTSHILDFLKYTPSKDTSHATEETTFVFLGPSRSGKSTLRKLLSSSSSSIRELKPTIGIDYQVTTSTNVSSTRVNHLYEIALDLTSPSSLTTLLKYLAIVITTDNLPSVHIALTISLAEVPHSLLHLVRMLHVIKHHVSSLMQHSKCQPLINSWYTESPSNIDSTFYCGIPIFLIATHFFSFDNITGLSRRSFVRSLRYVAHTHGCSLFFTDVEGAREAQVTRVVKIFKSICFGREVRFQSLLVDDNSAVSVFAGSDSLDLIGHVPQSKTRPSFVSKELSPFGITNQKLIDWVIYSVSNFNEFKATFIQSIDNGEEKEQEESELTKIYFDELEVAQYCAKELERQKEFFV
ncbi:hypothetical protein P9112_004279 [Eukaryota sp. TZLM1-RC]